MKNVIKLLILVMFVVVLSGTVYAGCCLETNTGQVCQDDVSQAACKEPLDFITCEGRSECTNKVCCEYDDGCTKGTLEATCIKGGGTPSPDEKCELSQCQLSVCCDVGGIYQLAKKGDCKDKDIVKDVGVDACTSYNDAIEKGCCRTDGDPICKINTPSECYGSGLNFYGGRACTDKEPVEGGCGCEAEATVSRSSEVGASLNSLYYYDSCGNMGEKKEDCDVTKGLYAGLSEDGINYECMDLNCKDLWDNPYTDENWDGILNNDKMTRIHAESWCEYQQVQVGLGRDLPGTSHYLHTCSSGHESVVLVGDSSERDHYCAESRKGEFSKAEALPIGADCSSEEDSTSCEGKPGCTWVDVRTMPGSKVMIGYTYGECPYKAVGFFAMIPATDCEYPHVQFNSGEILELYEGINKVATITWDDIIVKRTGEDAAFYNYTSWYHFWAQKWEKYAYVFVKPGIIEDNKIYKVIKVAGSASGVGLSPDGFTPVLKPGYGVAYTVDHTESGFEFSTYPPEGVGGKCVPIVPTEVDTGEGVECKEGNFNVDNIANWAGWTLDLPLSYNYYFNFLDEEGVVKGDDMKGDYIMEMTSKLSNSYNSKCGPNYDYLGRFGSGLSKWGADCIDGFDSGENKGLVDTLFGLREKGFSPYYLFKYGYAKDFSTELVKDTTVTGPVRPQGSVKI